jgi:trehalose-phosphatase
MPKDALDFLQWIQRTGLGNVIWATDLDLTVLGKSADPGKVAAPEGLEGNLRVIDMMTGGRFYIITGRELSYVDHVFPKTKFKASAEYHNMVRYDADGPVAEPHARPRWELIDERLEAIVAEHPGMVMRKKPFMRSIHYTHANSLKDEAVKDVVKAEIQALLDEHADKAGHALTNIDGGSVFDVAPEGSDKGKAYNDILALVRAKGINPVPIYFGDSPGDLPAADVVRANGGKFIAVGKDPRVLAVADFVLKDPEECCAIIEYMVKQGRQPAPGGHGHGCGCCCGGSCPTPPSP